MPDMEHSGRLRLPFLMPSQAQKHVTHNDALQMLDALVHLSVTGFDVLTPPASPQEGDVHAIGATPTGAWVGKPGKLAFWNNGGWLYLTPLDGRIACDLGTGGVRLYRAGSWQPLLQNLDSLGVGTTSDSENRLAVAAEATLLSHAGAGHRLKVNKAGAGDTASLLFQSGSDAFSIKVSPDGSAFTTALTINPATGLFSGGAISQSATDLTAERLLTVGAGAGQLDPALYGRGTVLGAVSPRARWSSAAPMRMAAMSALPMARRSAAAVCS